MTNSKEIVITNLGTNDASNDPTKDIPRNYEPINFEMDPIQEDLMFGDGLTEGMIVLLEDSLMRGNPELDRSKMDVYTLNRLNETSRWCKVTNIARANGIVRFIAVYSDGTKRARSYNEQYAWYYIK